MENYQEVKVNIRKDYGNPSQLFIKQLFISSSIITNFFMFGLFMGSITVLVPQMRREMNSTDGISSETVSWMSSTPVISAVPWAFILPLLAGRFGRKIPLLFVNMSTLICNIIFYRSTTATGIIYSEIVQGVLVSSVTNLAVMIMTEFTSPKYRGIFFAVKAATFYWGVWVSNAIGTYFHWKNIGIVIFACCIYNFTIIFYPESPYWLASKKRFEECAKSHRWLKGMDDDSEKELHTLISSHKHPKIDTKIKRPLKEFFEVLTCKIFYKPVIISLFSLNLYHFSGKLVYTVYAIDIIKRITESEKLAYQGMLILDGLTVLGMYIGSFFAKFVKRRTQLLSLATLGVGFLFCISLYLYLVKLNILEDNKYLSIFLLGGFSLSISCGPMILATCCHGELAPLKYRFSFLALTSLISYVIGFTFLKTSPSIFKRFDTHGAFLFYAVCASIFIYLLYRYLPETKDKTIQEIQRHFAGDDFVDSIDNVENESLPLNSNNK